MSAMEELRQHVLDLEQYGGAREVEMRQAMRDFKELIDAATDVLETGFNVAPTPSRNRLSAALVRIRGDA